MSIYFLLFYLNVPNSVPCSVNTFLMLTYAHLLRVIYFHHVLCIVDPDPDPDST